MRFFLSLLSLFILSSCQTPSRPTLAPSAPAGAYTLSSKGISGRVVSPGDWLGQDLDYPPFEQLRRQFEAQQEVRLKTRGEAHVTLISPPEMKVLRRSMTAVAMTVLAHEMDIENNPFDVICLGKGVKDQMATYFIVVRSPRWLEFRREVAKRAGYPRDFAPEDFHPHITLGFTDRDLFIQDGVVKNEKSCLTPVTVQ